MHNRAYMLQYFSDQEITAAEEADYGEIICVTSHADTPDNKEYNGITVYWRSGKIIGYSIY